MYKALYRIQTATKDKPPNGETTEELVTERLSLGNSAEPSVVNLLGVELHGVLWELEPLLYQRGQLSDPPPLLA